MSVHSASGLDSWEVSSVKSLTDFHLEKFCQLFHAVEETGSWPTALTYGFLTLLPKPDSDGSPATLRPLSILSVLYSLQAVFLILKKHSIFYRYTK